MRIVQSLSSQNTLRTLTEAEIQLTKRLLTINLGLVRGERVLIVTDAPLLSLAAVWFETAKQLTQPVALIVLEGQTHSGQEPPPELKDRAAQADVLILHTSHSLTHTSISKACQSAGGRVVSLPTVTQELFMRTLDTEYLAMKLLGEQLKQQLEQGELITITSRAGTQLTAQIRQNYIVAESGLLKPGTIANLPAGEVFFSPLEDTAEGTWVINGSIAGDKLDAPIALLIQAGRVVEIQGGAAAKRLQDRLTDIGPLAFGVAEIGIGTNREAQPDGALIEAEKAYGTAHLAVGNSSVIGGSISVPIHLDGVTLSPSIWVDDTVLMRDGEFVGSLAEA